MSEVGPEFYYDISNQTLLIGRIACDESVARGVNPLDIVPLEQALLDCSISDNITTEKLNVSDWDKNDYLNFGQWLNGVTPSTKLKSSILYSAYKLGIGPEPQRIHHVNRKTGEKLFAGFGEFFEKCGSKDSIYRYRFDDISFSSLLSFIKLEADKLAENGIRPSVKHFENLIESGNAPSRRVLKRIVGHTYGELLDMAGYFDARSRTKNDLVEWGVKFTLANNRPPYFAGIKKLSKNFKGPSKTSLVRRFGGILSYQTEVIVAHEEYLKEQSRLRSLKLDQIQLEIESGDLPQDLYNQEENDQSILNVARFRVVEKLLPDYPINKKIKLSCSQISPDWFAKIIMRLNPEISIATIETTALMLDVFDDIWKFDDYLTTLKVDDPSE